MKMKKIKEYHIGINDRYKPGWSRGNGGRCVSIDVASSDNSHANELVDGIEHVLRHYGMRKTPFRKKYTHFTGGIVGKYGKVYMQEDIGRDGNTVTKGPFRLTGVSLDLYIKPDCMKNPNKVISRVANRINDLAKSLS